MDGLIFFLSFCFVLLHPQNDVVILSGAGRCQCVE